MTFTEKLRRAVISSQSLLCVGLDPDPERIPAPLRDNFESVPEQVFEFCRRIIEATKTSACAFKPNLAFFEALGAEGWNVFEEIIDLIPSNRLVIADAKRGDIGNTARKYKEAFFDRLAVDAITLNPLMGMDTLDPFLNDQERAVFVLCMTSNRGAADFLQRRFLDRDSLGEHIAIELSKRQNDAQTHLGMVVGATQIDAIKTVLEAHPTGHLLIPGIGAQGGSLSELAVLLEPHQGIPIINSSRSIIYAGGDDENWIEKVSVAAAEMKESMEVLTKKYIRE